MLRSLKNLLGFVQKTGVSAQEIDVALADAGQQVVVAEQDLAKAQRAYRDGLLKLDEAAHQKILDQKQAAVVRQDRAKALVEALETKLATVRGEEAQAQKTAVYDAARTKRDAAAKRLRDEYAKHATAIASIIRECAEADAAVSQANADLPADDDPLLTVEAFVRDQPALPRKVIKEKNVSLWTYVSTGHILSPDLQAQVRSTGNDTGVLHNEGVTHSTSQVIRRKYRQLEFLRETSANAAERLATSVRLPGVVYGEPAIWDDTRSSQPDLVLARAAEMQTRRQEFSLSADTRAIEIEMLQVDDATAVESEAA